MIASIRSTDGVILLDGVPWMPNGLYHVSHYPTDYHRKFVDLARMADAGFNCIATPLTPATAVPFLDWCARLKCYALVEPNDTDNDVGFLAFVKQLKGHPGLLGWQVYDDLGRAGSKTPDEVKARTAAIKAIDPGALCYGSYGGNYRNVSPYVMSVDILGEQTYPVPSEQLSSTSNSIDAVQRAASYYHRSMIANCQAFQVVTPAVPTGLRPPTPAEVCMMAQRALVMQCHGMIWYAMYSEGNPTLGYPAWSLYETNLWPTMKRLAEQVNAIGQEQIAGKLR